MTLLKCDHLSCGYERKRLLEDISFSVNPGDYLCIVGENGAGKSTLMKTIVGLLAALDGHIELGDGLMRKDIGYLPQQTEIQMDFPASVKEIVPTGFLGKNGMRPFYTKEQKDQAVFHMGKLGIEPLKNRSYRNLSGGQQQRVLLARALCATHRILFLDEPTSGLDPAAAHDFYEIIAKLNREENITIVMVSHDVDTSLGFASHVLHLGNHQSLFFGSLEDYEKTPLCQSTRSVKG